MAQGGRVTITGIPLFAAAFAPAGPLDTNEKLLVSILSLIEVDPQHTYSRDAAPRHKHLAVLSTAVMPG
jgi:hypothetical protein